MDKIEKRLDQVDWNDSDSIIDFYESNRLYYDNFQLITSQDKIEDFVKIKLHYANALFGKSYYDKLFQVLDQVYRLLERMDTSRPNYFKSEQFARFLKGMVLGNQKKHKIAHRIFKRLIKEDPDHYYYRLWFNYTKYGLYNWIFNVIALIVGAIVTCNIFFSLDKNLSFDISIIGFIILGVTFVTQRAFYEYFKRKKNIKVST